MFYVFYASIRLENQFTFYPKKGNGEGEALRERDKCKKCKGTKVVKEKKYLDIYIDKGMQDGQKIVMQGEADQEVCEVAIFLISWR